MNRPADQSKNKPRHRLRTLLHSSVILSFLFRLANTLYDRAGKSAIAGFLTAYDADCLRSENSLLSKISDKLQINRRIFLPIRKFFNRAFFESPLLHFFRSALRSLADCPVSFYGIVFFSFGLYTTVLNLLTRFAFTSFEAVDNLYAGVVTVICALPALFCQKPLSETALGSHLGHLLICTLLGFREEELIAKKQMNPRPVVAFLIGLLLSALTVRLPLFWIPAGFLAVAGVALILSRPEAGIAIAFGAAAFLPTMGLAALLILTFVSFLCKLIQGKRTLRFEALDIAVLGLMLLFLIGGFVSLSPKDSIRPALMYTCLMLGYFMVVNLIKTSASIRRCTAFLCISLVCVAATGVWQNFTGDRSTVWQDTTMFSDIPGRVTSTFANPNVLGEFLIMTIPFMIAVILLTTHIGKKTGMTGLLAVCGACLIFTWSRGAWLGFLFSIVCLLLLYWRQTLVVLLFGIMASPLAILLVPDSVLNRFTSIGNLSDSSTSFRVNIWKGSLQMLKDYFVWGIGTGVNTFQQIYPGYSLGGIEKAAHSHNLYLEIMLELGLPGILMLLLFLILFIQSFFTYLSHRTERDERDIKFIAAAGFCGILAVLVQGMTDHIWYNYRIFCIFWLITALVSVCRRVGEAERIDCMPDGEQYILTVSGQTGYCESRKGARTL